MASAFNKLKKSLSLRLSSQSSSSMSSQPSDAYSDLSENFSKSSGKLSSSKLRKTCAICLGTMKPGRGYALFTAECTHSFHFHCIASSVKHGNQLCPICRAHWRYIPFPAPSNIPIFDSQSNGQSANPLGNAHMNRQSYIPPPEPQRFSDDEPLPDPPPTESANQLSSTHSLANIQTFTEFAAISASETQPEFAILVSLRAPTATQQTRAPIDLVTVLDVSGSMDGIKLTLLKRAVIFVIHQLDPADRLAIVSFSSSAQRVLPLCCMTEAGRNLAILAVNSLTSNGGTDIVMGLRKGIRVLKERREKNPVSSVILLSDGLDNQDHFDHRQIEQDSTSKLVAEYLNMMPTLIHCQGAGADLGPAPAMPVHTFGFGMDHDAALMHAISDVSGGTFSFIETEEVIQDAFAQCIGGLLTVVAQEVQLTLNSASPGVQIGKIHAGSYRSVVSDGARHGIINVGDLYAEEVKDFLVYVTVPICSNSNDNIFITPLLNVGCSYKVSLTRDLIQLEGVTVNIRRPKTVTSDERTVSVEVDRQRNRICVMEGIAEAQSFAEKGELERAKSILANRRQTLLSSMSAQAGDELCKGLEEELKEIIERMATREMYEVTGRAYVLSGMSSHLWQRATTRGMSMRNSGGGNTGGGMAVTMSGPITYETPSMTDMVTRSQTMLFPQPLPRQQRLHRAQSLSGRGRCPGKEKLRC